jgi:hypothetical protein
MRLLRLIFLLALALPATAQAEDATIVSRDLPLAGQRTLASAGAPERFNLVGLHWRGSGSVEFRTRAAGGRWSGWNPAAPEAEDRPDAATDERARKASWRLGNPWWVGPSDRIEYRTRGRVERLRAFFVWSPTTAVPARTLQRAGSPQLVPRRGWNADEKIRRGAPSFAPAIRFSVVHHTAGSNGYTAAQSASIVRAIQLYHVRGNGWNDIGYNFLVDKYGQVFEGRYGGVDRNVVGAHAEGFNTGSVGVAVLGEYSSLAVTGPARDALARLLAWRLDLAHLDPASTLSFPSGGNARFHAGVPVFLRAVSGHRDTGFTDCPGSVLYGLLNGIAGEVRQIGLPKLYSPLVSGRVPGKVRFRATLSSPLDWSVDVTNEGTVVASSSGYGGTVDWTWDATRQPPGRYGYVIRSGGDVTPATGAIGGTDAELALTGVAADPETVTPNGDGAGDASTITFTLNDAANVTVRVVDANGATVLSLGKRWRRALEHAVRVDPAALPDGLYAVVLEATATRGRTASASVPLAVSRTLGSFAASRAVFSPNADKRADTIGFSFDLAAPAEVKLRVLREGKWIATPLAGPLPAGAQKLEWNGAKRVGKLRDGVYEAVLEATDAVGTVRLTLPFASDTTPPRLRILSRSPLRVWASEPARLTVRAGGKRLVRQVKAPGEAKIWGAGTSGLVRIVAWDAAGNVSSPVSRR